jgi:DNA-binding NarL/FixJ family response regulator
VCRHDKDVDDFPAAAMKPVRILIANDHEPTRAGLRHALEDGGFDVVAEASNAQEALELARRERPEICLLDVDMPGNGIRAAGEISSSLPGTAVVMLSDSSHETDLFDALRAGALGFLLIDTDPARIPHALHGVLAGEAAVPRKLVMRLIDEFRSQGRSRRVPVSGGVELTGREWEVITMMRGGISTAEVAERLFVSPVTVRRHVSAVVQKLGVADRDAALRLLDEAA